MRQYFHNRLFITTLFVSLCINGGLWFWLSSRLEPSVEAIPLHYTIYFGIDLVGPWWYRFGFPAAGLGVIIVNGGLAMLLYERKRFLTGLLLFVSFVVQVLLAVSAYFSVTNV